MKDFALAVLALSFAVTPAFAQEREPSPFGCRAGAVDILVDGHPRLRFESLERPPSLLTGHEFTFDSSPVGLVRVYLTATVPEEQVGRESTAQLTVYAETVASLAEATSGTSRWWRLAGRPRADQSFDTSHGLWFQAAQVARCFGGSTPGQECEFADVTLATDDQNLPLIAIGFTQNLGGANARNWTDARLLLDFRSSPPKVAATLDCSYNEGGGACAAIDSSLSPRSTLDCRWDPAPKDFVCTETTSDGFGAHRDFYLFANRLAPARDSEVASLDEAADLLARKGRGQTVTVHKLGPVSFVEEVRMEARTSAMLLAGGGAFYLATRTGGKSGDILAVVPHGMLDPATPPERAGPPEGRWTTDGSPRFVSQVISRSSGLTVLQVAAVNGHADAPPGEGVGPDQDELYWIGIQQTGDGFAFDATRLLASGRYAGCGKSIVPPAVVSIGEIRKPFRADLRVQPAIVDSIFDDGGPQWFEDDAGQEQRPACVSSATVTWTNDAFVTTLDGHPCAAVDKPHRVRVGPDGRLRLDASGEGKD